jgi:hypothetical protein
MWIINSCFSLRSVNPVNSLQFCLQIGLHSGTGYTAPECCAYSTVQNNVQPRDGITTFRPNLYTIANLNLVSIYHPVVINPD